MPARTTENAVAGHMWPAGSLLPIPALCDAVTFFVHTNQFFCHCFSIILISIDDWYCLHNVFLDCFCLLALSYETINHPRTSYFFFIVEKLSVIWLAVKKFGDLCFYQTLLRIDDSTVRQVAYKRASK